MKSDQELEERTGATLSPFELEQIRDAMGELRTSRPDSVLADLVEEKIRAIENGYPVRCPMSHRPEGSRSPTTKTLPGSR
jgi:hypothetical protein